MTDTPRYYDPARIGTLFYPDVMTISSQAAESGLSKADGDEQKVLLLIVDMQVDFCHEEGTLFVPGALADIRRLTDFIFRSAGRISSIMCSLDSHLPFQIFHPVWWVDCDGRHPEPLTVIRREDVEHERWRPVQHVEWSRNYVRRLEENAEKELMIWPYHVPMGGVGHMLDPELWSAVFWHSIARRTQPIWWNKGMWAKTEHYSVVRPEVISDEGQDQKAKEFRAIVDAYDHIVIAGEAASHCVLETVEDLIEIGRDRPERRQQLTLLTDCTSPVAHPEVDFGALAEKRFHEFAEQGVQLAVSSELELRTGNQV